MSEKREIFCLYDRVAKDYGPIFEAKTLGAALRMLTQYFDTQKGLSVKDYEICRVGIFREADGRIYASNDDIFRQPLDEYIMPPSNEVSK
uniref:Nonstructural protein n=1 Tax=Dulem virus 177 TaxID=3145654 RepID=A0AAU8B017_9VIRU